MIRVRQIKVSIDNDNSDFLLRKIEKKINTKVIDYKIIKKSIDARKKEIFFVYEVDCNVLDEDKVISKVSSNDIFLSSEEKYTYNITGSEKINDRIIVVGSGPSGLFCAYFLSEAGYKVLVLEQGEKMEDRIKSVDEFFSSNKLNILSNIQFGEGGAGTFSDGKLNTLVKDKKHIGKRVFEIFVENGAPEEIMYEAKPHIGTDILRKVIVNIRKKIESFGGEFLFNSKMTDIYFDNNIVSGVEVNNSKKISCNVLVLAIGHSSRDTFYLLKDKKFLMKNKNFSVGVRIVHPKELIDKSQYGSYYKKLGAASYKLVHQCSNGRSVYSFCMCPGGYVVNASSEEGLLAVNGMSNYDRGSSCSNSAIVVNVLESDYGTNLLDGVEFQRKLEKKAYELGKGYIPVQLFGDYLKRKESNSFGSFKPEVLGKTSFTDLNKLFPDFINESIKEGIQVFDKKIKGFAADDTILMGVESRTSSPVTIVRNELGVSNYLGVYPCGEGCGYAGGITTAAIDGVLVFENIIKVYRP